MKLARMHLLSAGYASALLLIALLSQGKLLSHRAGGCGAGSRRYEGKVPYLQVPPKLQPGLIDHIPGERRKQECGCFVVIS